MKLAFQETNWPQQLR